MGRIEVSPGSIRFALCYAGTVLLVAAAALSQRLYIAAVLPFERNALFWDLVAAGTLAELLPLVAVLFLAQLPWLRLLARPLAFLIAFFTIFAIGLDTLIFSQTHSRVSALIVKNLSYNSLQSYSTAGNLGSIALLGLLCLTVLPLVRFATDSQPSLRLRVWVSLSTAVLAAGAAHQKGVFGLEPLLAPSPLISLSSFQNIDRAIGIDTWSTKTISPRSWPLDPDEAQILAELGLADRACREPAYRGPPFRRVLLVVMESLARDFLKPFSAKLPAETLPFLSRLAEERVHFDEHWTTNLPTIEGIYSTALSRPYYDPAARMIFDLPTLFSVMNDAGYESYFVRGTHGFLPHEESTMSGLLKVPHLLSREELALKYGDSRRSKWGYDDLQVLNEAVSLLHQHRDGKVVVLAELMDSHPGYWKPRDHQVPDSLTGSQMLSSLNWVDRCLWEMFRLLRERGLYDRDTLVVLTSDHSPNHGEYLRWVNEPDYLPARIPLILLSDRGLNPPHPPQALSSQIDLAPTILDLAGLPTPDSFWGTSLMDPARAPLALSVHGDYLHWRFPGREMQIYPFSDERQLSGLALAERAVAKWSANMLYAGRIGRRCQRR